MRMGQDKHNFGIKANQQIVNSKNFNSTLTMTSITMPNGKKNKINLKIHRLGVLFEQMRF